MDNRQRTIWPPFVQGLVVWQISAAVGSLVTVIAWAALGFNGLGGFGPRLAMSWLLATMLSTPLALLMFAIAQTASTRSPHLLRRRTLLTHDLGALVTLSIVYFAMVPKEFTWETGGEAIIIGVVYPIVGTLTWRKFFEFSGR